MDKTAVERGAHGLRDRGLSLWGLPNPQATTVQGDCLNKKDTTIFIGSLHDRSLCVFLVPGITSSASRVESVINSLAHPQHMS